MASSNKKLTLRQQAVATYLKGCNVMDVAPEKYGRWTIADLEKKTDELRASWARQRKIETEGSIAKNTRAVATKVETVVGDTFEDARDKAQALARKLGRAVPFKVVRR